MSTTSPSALPQLPSVEALIKRRRPLRNVHKEALQTITPLDRLALWITVRVWLDGVFPVHSRMDGLLVGLEFTGPCGVAVRSADGLRVLAVHIQRDPDIAHAIDHGWSKLAGPPREVRAEHDLEVNVRAEREIEVILRHLEYQNTMLIAMVQKLGIEIGVGVRHGKS